MAMDDPRARDMLRAYRQHGALGEVRGAAIWTRVERSLDRGPAIDDHGREPIAPWRLRRRWIAAVAIAAGAVLAMSVAPHLVDGRDADGRAAQAAFDQGPRARDHVAGVVAAPAGVAELDPTPRVVPPVGVGEPPSSPEVTSPEPSRGGPRSRPRSAETPPSTDDADALVVELGLVRRARRALQDRDPSGALALLDAHAEAFPRGQMLEDRLALRVEALCAVGAERAAHTEAGRLRRLFPRSPHVFDQARPCVRRQDRPTAAQIRGAVGKPGR